MNLNTDFLKLYEELSKLNEAKTDIQNLINFAGEDLANRFLAIKHRLKAPENDLYYWIKNKTVSELEDVVNRLEITKSTSATKKDIADQGAELVGENEYWKVYHITTYEAAQAYGRDTKWCITGIGAYGDKYWKDYTSKGVQFYFYIAKDEYDARGFDSKIALALYRTGRYEIFDQQDSSIEGIVHAPDIAGLPDVDIAEDIIDTYEFNGSAVPADLYSKIKHIKVQEGITVLDNEDFSNFTRLEKVTLPDSLQVIGAYTFYDCPRLRNITIPDGVTTIENHAFSFSGLTSIELPDSVVTLGHDVFNQCENLTAAKLSNNIKNIEEGLFLGCSKLSSINIPTIAQKIGRDAFLNCEELTELSIPGSVKTIERNAFNGCTKLSKVEIAEGLEIIETYAFAHCYSLSDIKIPRSVKFIEKDAFIGSKPININ